MSIEVRHVTVGGLRVEVVRKDIRNLHLGVYPPNGRVRVAAPLVISDDAVRLAVVDKLAWIKRQRAQFAKQPRQSVREMVSGESHYFMGRRYRLRVHEHEGSASVAVRGIASIDLFVRSGTDQAQRAVVLHRWYRQQLKALIPSLLVKWQPLIGVDVEAWGIKRMKTKWGSCIPTSRRIWLNLELAKKSPACLEYVLVHELMHLHERHHNEQFVAMLDKHLPMWRAARDSLNAEPLGAENWAAAE